MRSCPNSEPLKLITFPVRVAHAKQIYLPSFAIYCTPDKKTSCVDKQRECFMNKVWKMSNCRSFLFEGSIRSF